MLVTIYGPLQREDEGAVPAHFKGEATISTADDERKVPLNADNIRLTPAKACPTRPN